MIIVNFGLYLRSLFSRLDFGAPGKFHSDCGGVFANDVFREMNEKLGIETSPTNGESPFSNGVVERKTNFCMKHS